MTGRWLGCVLGVAALAACGTGEQDTSEQDTSEVDTSEQDSSEVDTSEQDTSEVDTSEQDTSEEEPTAGSEPSGPCRVEMDDVYGEVHNVLVYTYDAEGRLLWEASSEAYRTTYEYDADGNQTVIREVTSDQTVLDVLNNTFDERGNLLTSSMDYGADGSVESVVSYTYDERDNTLSVVLSGKGRYANQSTVYTYDAEDHVLTEHHDNDGDLIYDILWTYAYDEAGNLLTKSQDYGLDGVLDEQTTYKHDAEGRLVEQALDQGLDGVFEVVSSYAYDAQGNEVMMEMRFPPESSQSDIRHTSTFDAAGNLLTLETDVEIDGTVDLVKQYYYECEP